MGIFAGTDCEGLVRLVMTKPKGTGLLPIGQVDFIDWDYVAISINDGFIRDTEQRPLPFRLN
jgi:hypothetical protein